VQLALLPIALLLSGCVSAKYQRTDADCLTSPVSLNLTSEQSPVTATLHSVIAIHGPGSWKRDAYWDEYVVSVVNRSEAPLAVQSATLTDFLGHAMASGDKPWPLEEESLSRLEGMDPASKAMLVQVGAGYGAASAGVAVAMAGAGPAGLVLFPAYIGGAIYRNVGGRHDIEHEFARRRFVLPATLAPGQTAQGSFFFPISPGPQRLTLKGKSGEAPLELVLELKPLAGMHLKPAEVN
jgi:hypothetical protein